MFDGWFGKGRTATAARKAELRGDLAKAVELFAEAGLPEEAARVLVLRGDSEVDPKKRMPHYTQAARLAPEKSVARAQALKKRAALVVALAGDGPISAAARHDLLEAARDLEAIGEQQEAAAAYARAGDAESEARALAQAGDVDQLEHVLGLQHAKERAERKARETVADVELLAASGRRREAAAAAEAFAEERASTAPAAQTARDRAAQIRARRAMGPIARLLVRGAPMNVVLGEEVTIGRTEGSLTIASNAVSRKHLRVAREAGTIVVRDLGSRNGTTLRGLAIAGAVPVGEGLELRLGKEVPLEIAPSVDVPGAVVLDVAGTRYVAPLGAAKLGVGAWRLEHAGDGWIELVTDDDPPALLADVRLVPRVTLLVGDAIGDARGEEPVLRVLG